MVFTSPPYFTIEKYEGMPSYDSYDGWVAEFLEPVVRKSYAGLSRNGYIILNIPDKIYQSVKKILGGADTHFPLVIQQRHLNTKNHQLSSKGEYSEQVYVWRK
jgi:DNA modification methylase